MAEWQLIFDGDCVVLDASRVASGCASRTAGATRGRCRRCARGRGRAPSQIAAPTKKPPHAACAAADAPPVWTPSQDRLLGVLQQAAHKQQQGGQSGGESGGESGEIDEETRATYRAVFDKFDTDGTGTVSRGEMAEMLKQLVRS